MANAWIHSKSSARKFGGEIEDYLSIHMKMDCSKAYVADNRHRTLTHTNFWIHEVMIPIFSYTIKNSAGKEVSVKDVCEQHILEDFGMRWSLWIGCKMVLKDVHHLSRNYQKKEILKLI